MALGAPFRNPHPKFAGAPRPAPPFPQVKSTPAQVRVVIYLLAWTIGGWGSSLPKNSRRPLPAGFLGCPRTADSQSGVGRAVRTGKKKCSGTSFPKKARGHSMCSTMVGGSWRLAVGGGWRLAVGSWRLVAVGGGWWLVVGGWWRLAVVGSWRLVAAGGWRRLVAGGWWRLVAVGS